jgi:hypothetical protein
MRNRVHRASVAATARCALLFSLAVCGTGPALAATSETSAVLERRVKAALIHRFINYVEWPESAFNGPGAPFLIAVAGAEALVPELEELAAGRSVLDRPLAVRKLKESGSAKDVHILFVGRDEASQLPALLRAVPTNALIVTEWDDALQQGSVINFVLVDRHVRFEIALDTAQKRGIRLSSRLLSVAHRVRP